MLTTVITSSNLQFTLNVNIPVSVCIKHGKQILGLFITDFELGNFLNSFLELFGSESFLVEHVILQVINVGEEILE